MATSIVAATSRTRTFYRVVAAQPPTPTDFKSPADREIAPLPGPTEMAGLAQGLSVYATLAQARRKARTHPWLGGYIAVLKIPAEAAVAVERTLPGSRGHHTLWGEPATLLACVVAVGPAHAGA